MRTVTASVLFAACLFVLGVGAYLVSPAELEARETCTWQIEAYSWHRTTWPPGMVCTYQQPDGADVTVVTHVPIGEWAMLVLWCGAGGTAAAFTLRRLGRWWGRWWRRASGR